MESLSNMFNTLESRLEKQYPDLYVLESSPSLSEELHAYKKLAKTDKPEANKIAQRVFAHFERLSLTQEGLSKLYSEHHTIIQFHLETKLQWRGPDAPIETLGEALEAIKKTPLSLLGSELTSLETNLQDRPISPFAPPQFPDNLGLPGEVKFSSSPSPTLHEEAPSPVDHLEDSSRIPEEEFDLPFPKFCVDVLPKYFSTEVLKKGFLTAAFKELTHISSSPFARETFVETLRKLSR